MYSTLITNLENKIFTITVNRPDKLNALNQTVLNELSSAVDKAYSDTEIKAVIIQEPEKKRLLPVPILQNLLEYKMMKALHLQKKGRRFFSK